MAAEVLKLRTTRTFWTLAGVTFGLILLIVVLSLILDDELDTNADSVESLLSTGGLAGVFMLILGAVVGAGEYRHGTIASTLLVTPNRLRAVTAQTLACALGGLLVGLAAVAIVAAISLPVLSGRDAPLPDTAAALRIVLGTCLFSGLAAALGVALGAAVRNQVAAIVSLLLIFFVVDGIIAGLAGDYARYTLSGLSSAIGGESEDPGGFELFPQGVAALIWTGYTLVLMGLAAFLTSKRDI